MAWGSGGGSDLGELRTENIPRRDCLELVRTAALFALAIMPIIVIQNTSADSKNENCPLPKILPPSKNIAKETGPISRIVNFTIS